MVRITLLVDNYLTMNPKEVIFVKPEKHYMVNQSNKVIEARYHLSLYEQRIVLMMISLIEPDDVEFKEYRIKISDFKNILGLKGDSAYSKIKETLRKLRSRELLIESGKNYLVTGWITSAKYVAEEGEVTLSFDPNLEPYFLNLKEQYVSNKLGVLISFKSTYTVRLYTLLKQYKKIGQRTFNIEVLREVLGLSKNQYTRYSSFKERVICVPQKELESKSVDGEYKSDLGFDFEEVKSGRKVVEIKFIIKNRKNSLNDIFVKESPSKTVQYLTSYGVSFDKSKELSKNHSEEEVIKCISIFEEKKDSGKLNSKGAGLLVTLIESGAGLKTKREEEEERRNRERADNERAEYLEKLRGKLALDYEKIAKKEFLDSLDKTQKQDLLEWVLSKYENTTMLYDIVKKDGLQAKLAGSFILKQIPDYKRKKEEFILREIEAIT